MAVAKTKKPAAKKTAAKTTTKKAPAKKASPKAAAKPKVPATILADNSFAKFTGYRNEVDADEIVFEEGETIYIISHEETDEGIMYAAIKASDIDEYEESGLDNVAGGEVGPSEVTALTGKALEKAQEKFAPVPVYGKLEEMLAENDNAIEVAISLNHEVQQAYFWLGGALAMVLHDGSYLTENGGDYEGENAWAEFVEAEFGFSASKAADLVRIYRVFSGLEGFDPSNLESIGWSKAAIASNYVTPENVEEILEDCSETTQAQLRPLLKEKYTTVDGKTAAGKSASRGITRRTLTFSLDEAVADAVDLALQAAIKQKGIEGPEKIAKALALEAICVEWANEHVEASTKQKAIQSKVNKAQKAREATAPKAAAPAKATGRTRKKAA
jgi:hypothetical protein